MHTNKGKKNKDALTILAGSVSKFVSETYQSVRGKENYLEDSSTRLRLICKERLPLLLEKLNINAPDIIFGEVIIEFALKGIQDDTLEQIWQHHYIKGENKKTVAENVGYSSKQISRILEALPTRVAKQLWKKEVEYSMSKVSPFTRKQHRITALRDAYSITERRAEVLLEFCLNESLGRVVIANRLNISVNSLKKHTKKILRHTNSKKMNEAVSKARALLIRSNLLD